MENAVSLNPAALKCAPPSSTCANGDTRDGNDTCGPNKNECTEVPIPLGDP